MKYIFGVFLIFVSGAAFWSNANFKNRHYLDYTEKERKNFTKWQLIFLGLIIIGFVMIFV